MIINNINNTDLFKFSLICRFFFHATFCNETQQCIFKNFQAQNGLNLGRIRVAPLVSQHEFNIFTVTHHLSGIWVWELTNLAVVRELKGMWKPQWIWVLYFLSTFYVKICILSKKKKKEKKTVKLIGITEQVELIITWRLCKCVRAFQ